MKQTYENYYKEYFKGKGKEAKLRAQRKYRAKNTNASVQHPKES